MPVEAQTAVGPEAVRAAGIVIAAALAAAAILAPTARGRAWAMLGALALTPVLLVLSIWETPQLEIVREHTLPALAAIDPDALAAAEAAGEELPPSRPALALTEVGEGIVIRVGLPEWGVRLKAGSAPVQQLTRNIADILRGTTPAIRTF